MDPTQASMWQKLLQNPQNSSVMPDLPFDAPLSPLTNMKAMGSQSQGSVDPSKLAQQTQGIPVPGGTLVPVKLPQAPQPPSAPQSQSIIGKYMARGGSDPSVRASKQTAESALYNLVGNNEVTPAIKEQQDSVNDLNNKLQKYVDQPRQVDLSPLAALTDAWTGSKFAQSYQKPETNDERAKNIAALQNMVAQRQGDLSKEQTSLLKDKIGAMATIVKANKETAPVFAALQDRLDNSNHQRTLASLRHDQPLIDLYKQSAAIAKGQDMLTQAQVVPPQQFDEFQQIVRRNLGISGPSGLNEREKTMFNNMGLSASKAEQYLFGSPVNVRESQADFFKHMLDVANVVNKANQKQVVGRINANIAGNESMYARRKDLYSDLMNAKNATLDQFAPENLGTTGASAPSANPELSFEDFKKLKAEGKL